MKTKHERFLKQLLETPSPTGYEVPVADVVAPQTRSAPMSWARCTPC